MKDMLFDSMRFAAVLGLAGWAAGTAPARATLVTNDVVVVQDTYVDQAASATNFSAGTQLRIQSGSTAEKNIYLKFAVSDVAGRIDSATLRIYSVNVVGNVALYSVPDTAWNENAVVWSNRPATGPLVATAPSLSNSWIEFDVSSVVAGNGTYAFCLKAAGTLADKYFRSQATGSKPFLRFVTEPVADWQVVSPLHSTNETVVAGIVIAAGRLPADPANQDCAASFQSAMQEMALLGGGTVFVPAGEYLFENPIDIPPNVVLYGDWGDVSGADKSVRGTVLKVTYNGARSFIRMQRASKIRDLSIWYPQQSLANVIPYAATIDAAYKEDGVTPANSTSEVAIENINLVNSYVGIAPQSSMPRMNVFGVYGSPLSLGVYQKASSDIPMYSDLVFSAAYWAESGLPGAPAKAALQAHMRANTTGVLVGSSDNILASDWHMEDCNQGFRLVDEGLGNINGNLHRFSTANCVTGLVVNSIGPTFFIDCSFQGTDAAIALSQLSNLGVTFNGCSFSTEGTFDVACNWNGNLARKLSFQNCSFSKKLLAGTTDLSVVDSSFALDAAPIVLTAKTRSVVLAGNEYAYAHDPVQLNGASGGIVARYEGNTFSKRHTPFDPHGYLQQRMPSGNALAVMGDPLHPVVVDGVTDAAPAIQSALNEVALQGGGVVFLPQRSPAGYAIRTPLAIPAGVELRSTWESIHSFNASQAPLGGALLQVYVGKTNATPAIVMHAGSGLKGLTIHYPEFFTDAMVPFSPTVKVVGDRAYIKNIQFVNAYRAMVFEDCSDYLAEQIIADHVYRVAESVRCANGRLQRINVRDEWDVTGYPTYQSRIVFAHSLSNCIPYEITDCTNQQIYATFQRMSHWMGLFSNSTVHALQYSSESCENGIMIRGIPAGGAVELIGTSMRFNEDTKGPVTGFSVETAPSDGEFRIFSSLVNGFPDTFLASTDADITFQQALIDLGTRKIATHGVKLLGSGVVRLENCIAAEGYLSTEVADVAGNRLELVGNYFNHGFEYATLQSRMAESLEPAELAPSVRMAQVANWSIPAVATSLNLAEPGNSGMALLTTEVARATKDVSFRQYYSSVTGYVPTNAPKELLFEVSARLFDPGAEPDQAELVFNYYDWQAGQLQVLYKRTTDADWISAGITNLTGDGGYVLPAVKDAVNPYWKRVSYPVPGSVFAKGTQFRLAVTSGEAIFSYLRLASLEGYREAPYGAALNAPPAFLLDPIVFSNAVAGAAFSNSIAALADDPDYGETLLFSKVSGPAWLVVSTNGTLSGSPLASDAGTNVFVVQVSDAGGLTDQSALFVVVENAEPVSVVAAWDLTTRRDGTSALPPGWTKWTSEDLTNGVPSTVAGLTWTHTAGTFGLGLNQIETPTRVFAEAAPLLALADNSAAQRVYEDWMNNLTGNPVFTLSGLTPGQEYWIQFVGTFFVADKNVSIKQDGAAAENLIAGTHSVAKSIAYSRHFSFAATAGDTDVAFQFGNVNGTAGNQGIAGIIVATVTGAPSDPYAEWALLYDLAGGAADDDDNDGLPNLYEYAVGGNPTNAGDLGFASTTAVLAMGGTNWFEYVYPRRKGDAGLAYRLELSGDLTSTNWVSGGYVEIPPAGNLDAEFEAVTNRVDTADAEQQFIRLIIDAL